MKIRQIENLRIIQNNTNNKFINNTIYTRNSSKAKRKNSNKT